MGMADQNSNSCVNKSDFVIFILYLYHCEIIWFDFTNQVKYFDKRREYLKFKDRMESDGYQPPTDGNSNKQT